MNSYSYKSVPKQFLTVKQVSKLLGVTPLTIRNWDKRGRLQAYRNPINNYRVYKIEDVENLLKDIEGTRGVKEVVPANAPKTKKILIEEL